MSERYLRHAAVFAFAAVAVWGTSFRVFAQDGGRARPERFTAAAMDTNRGVAGNVEIQIDRWSTDAERDRLMKALLDKGPDKLLDVLQDAKAVGSIRTPGSLAYDLHFARRTPLPEGGERVVLATDRRISFWEQFNNTRTVDYPFTVIELRLNRNGDGEGKMSLATRITADKENGVIVLENWDLQPVLLRNVKREE
jgi:hypothetical protein